MPALDNYQCEGTLDINGVSLNTPAWTVLDLSGLWAEGDIRGQDRLVPGVPGVVAYRRRRTITKHQLNMVFTGSVDQAGLPFADEPYRSNPAAGLERNLDQFRADVLEPPTFAGTDGTYGAVLTMPSGVQRFGRVHVEGFDTAPLFVSRGRGAVIRAVLTISIPDGRLTVPPEPPGGGGGLG